MKLFVISLILLSFGAASTAHAETSEREFRHASRIESSPNGHELVVEVEFDWNVISDKSYTSLGSTEVGVDVAAAQGIQLLTNQSWFSAGTTHTSTAIFRFPFSATSEGPASLGVAVSVDIGGRTLHLGTFAVYLLTTPTHVRMLNRRDYLVSRNEQSIRCEGVCHVASSVAKPLHESSEGEVEQ